MSIKLKELKVSFNKLCRYLEKMGITEFDPEADMYWYIAKEICYNPYKVPTDKDLTIGQLSFDINGLKDLIEEKIPPNPYHLIWLSAVLRALADSMGNKKKSE